MIESNNETVESLAYDSSSKMLLWIDGFNHSIRQVQIGNSNASVEIVHFLENDARPSVRPRALVSDPCKRY
jgi:hypothetical protein